MKRICLLTAIIVCSAITTNCLSNCNDNSDCPYGYYCKKAIGNCDGTGTCTQKPASGCDPLNVNFVCGCDEKTYINPCYAAMAGVNIKYEGPCQKKGPLIIMTEPKTTDDNIHIGESEITYLKLLWDEPLIFDANNITITDLNDTPITFTAEGDTTALMTITFDQPLLYDTYTITIDDSVVSGTSGYPIDGDNNGHYGGDAIITIHHRERADLDNNHIIDFYDFAILAEKWLMNYENPPAI